MTGALLALVLAFPSPPQFGLPAIGGGGSGNKFTGSPRSKWDCAVCHEGEALPPVRVTALADSPFEGGYQPGKSYPLELSIEGAAMSAGVSFELLTREGVRAGALAPSGVLPSELACDDGSDPIAIGRDGVAMSRSCRSGIASWRVVWTAPEGDVGPVTLYAGAVDGDKDGSCKGDRPGSATVAIRGPTTAPLPKPASCAGAGLLPLGVLAALWRRRARRASLPILMLGLSFVTFRAPLTPSAGSFGLHDRRMSTHAVHGRRAPARAKPARVAPPAVQPSPAPSPAPPASSPDPAPADAAAPKLTPQLQPPVTSAPSAAPELAAPAPPDPEPPAHYAEATATVGAGMRSLLLVS
ncbi:MAG: choice-of-anchor V domain-containing protein, partial [Myxococcaceae bacterium]